MADWPQGVDRRVFATLDSTMAEAARLAPAFAAPTWILAHEQTAGRGRRGRDWVQPAGNFSATLIWSPTGTLEARAQRSFVAALALRDAFVAATGREAAFRLKWPNDVLLNGGKVAGILLESIGTNLAIGFGVNLLAAPMAKEVETRAPLPVSLAKETGAHLTPEAFLDLLAAAYAQREAEFTTRGFAHIRADWLRHAVRLGQEITARLPNREITGIFQTVDEQGALVLKAPDGLHHIPAADIFFAPRADERPGHAASD